MKRILCLCFVLVFVCSSAYASASSGYVYCWNCGTKIVAGCNYCPSCGAQQNGTAGAYSGSASGGYSSSPATGNSYYVGDVVLFGRYEQDNVSHNGTEDIQWIVLDVDQANKKMLLMSKYGIDNVKYNSVEASVNWDTCSLRSWLNTSFLNNAFTYSEQSSIADSYVSAQANPEYADRDPGKDTTDKIFILSTSEADYYLNNADLRKCTATAYAEAQGVTNYHEENGNCWWWMRNPGYHHNRAVHTYIDGSWNYDGAAVHRDDLAVRPVMWVYY